MPTQWAGTRVPIVGRAEPIKRLLKHRAVVAVSAFVACSASDRPQGEPSNTSHFIGSPFPQAEWHGSTAIHAENRGSCHPLKERTSCSGGGTTNSTASQKDSGQGSSSPESLKTMHYDYVQGNAAQHTERPAAQARCPFVFDDLTLHRLLED